MRSQRFIADGTGAKPDTTGEEREQKMMWNEKPEHAWDGTFPIADWDRNKYFFDLEQFMDYLNDRELDDEEDGTPGDPFDVSDLQLTSCDEQAKPTWDFGHIFDGGEYTVDDDAPYDQEAKEIEALVNDWLQRNSPTLFSMTGKRLRTVDVQAAIDANRSAT